MGTFLPSLVVAIAVCVAVFEPRAQADGCTTVPAEAARASCELDQAKAAEKAAHDAWDKARAELNTAPAGATADAQARVDAARKELIRLELLTQAAQRSVDALSLSRPNGAAPPRESKTCKHDLVICYDRDGSLAAGDALPNRVHVGDKVTVLVFTTLQTFEKDQLAISVSFQGRQSSEHLFTDDAASKIGTAPAPAPSDVKVLAYSSDEVPNDAAELAISFSHPDLPGSVAVSWTEMIHVDHGYSYFSVALLVAATFKADRRVLRDLNTVADHSVDPGFALNIFPGGREVGVIGYARRGGGLSRWLANTLGFQLGTDLDLTNPVDKFYAGVVFEPVAGLAVVGGVSLRKVAVVPLAGALPALESDDASPSDERYVLRGYVGITITLDLLKSISSLGSGIRGVALP